MAAMTPRKALKEFLDDDDLRTVSQPILDALTQTHSTANTTTSTIDQLASSSSIDSFTRNEENYHNFYQAYFQAVRYTGSSVPNAKRLVELLNTLSENGSPPLIGMYIEEYGLDIAPELGNSITPLDVEEWDSHIGTFTSAQTWAAVYYLHGTIANVKTDLLWGAEFLFVNALETSLDTDVHIRASRLYLESTQRWMQICGRQLYDTICRGQSTSSRPHWSTDSGIVDHGGKWLWTGGHVLDMSRWDFWKSRFAMLADLQLLDQTARCWARDGLRCMGEVDGSKGRLNGYSSTNW